MYVIPKEEEMRHHRFLIMALVLVGILAFGAATATAAANFKSSSFSVNSLGQLVCSYDVSGLGNVSSTLGTCGGNNTAVYQCINNGGKNPAAGNKSTSTGEVNTSQQVPVHNGRASGSLTVDPAGPGGFSCPNGQTLYLVSSCYTDVSMDIGGATASDPGPICSGPIMVRP
jgi:hypothetical protein